MRTKEEISQDIINLRKLANKKKISGFEHIFQQLELFKELKKCKDLTRKEKKALKKAMNVAKNSLKVIDRFGKLTRKVTSIKEKLLKRKEKKKK